jgi:hypothetical protein
VVEVKLDKTTNYLATPVCPNDYDAAFITGTQPNQTCDMTAGGNFLQKLFGVSPKPPAPGTVSNPAQPVAQQLPPAVAGQPAQPSQTTSASTPDDKKKKGFFGKLFGAIKGDNKDQNQPQSSPTPAPR